MKIECWMCNKLLTDEEMSDPRVDSENNIICDDCYHPDQDDERDAIVEMKKRKNQRIRVPRQKKPWAIAALVGGPYHGRLMPHFGTTESIGCSLLVPLRTQSGFEPIEYNWLSWTDQEVGAGDCATKPPVYVAVYAKLKTPTNP
jgi:hypothetical protein